MVESLVMNKFGNDFIRSGEELVYHCPFCPDLGKRNNDRKLYVNSKSGKFICFRCGTSGTVIDSKLSELLIDGNDLIEEMINFVGNKDTNIFTSDSVFFCIPDKHLVDYPGTVPYNYMIRRGITPDMMELYSIRAFGDGKQFHNRVVIPNRIINKNWTDFYTSRAILDGMLPRYYNSKFSNKNNIVFNIDNIPFGSDIIVNEGCINSIIAGTNSVAILGKYASISQINQIASKNPKVLYISLDYDARDIAIKLASSFHNLLPECQINLVDLPENEDAASLGRLNYLEFVESSKLLYSNDITSVFEDFIINI